MRNLKTIEKKVRAVLEKNEDARNDDMVLYLALCNACLKDAGAMPLAACPADALKARQTKIFVLRHYLCKRHCPCIQSLQGAALFKK